jgi:hypothetical protein
MSNTIRRRNIHGKAFYDPEFVYFNKAELNHNRKKVQQKCKALFHSDKYDFNAPKSYRINLNRDFRVKNKNVLKRIIKEEKDYCFIPFKHNANWNYY